MGREGPASPPVPGSFKAHLSATSSQASCLLLQSEEQLCAHCPALLPGPGLHLTLQILSGKVPLSLPVLLEYLGLP